MISTVDYLLRLQESVSDFYWYYSSKDSIDDNGKEHFADAIAMAKQVFNSLTEYIQASTSHLYVHVYEVRFLLEALFPVIF